jgi:hypothetical protein
MEDCGWRARRTGWALVERSLGRNVTLIPYIRSFMSREHSFLEWMYTQANPPPLECLDLKWQPEYDAEIDCKAETYSNLADLIPPPSRDNIRELRFRLNWSVDEFMLSSLYLFRGLCSLKLYASHEDSDFTLQSMLERLHAPSLELLEVSEIRNWRIQWRASFEDALPNLRALKVKVGWDDSGMYGNGDKPSEDEWHTLVTMYRRSIFLWNDHYTVEDPTDPFLELAPYQARIHGLDPILFVQWRVKSIRMFRGLQFISLGPVPMDDLTIIFRAMKSIDFRQSYQTLGVVFPPGTTPSIAHLLPNAISINELRITIPSDCHLDPSVVPACIRSLPELCCLRISLSLSENKFQPSNKCTIATCSFPSLPDVRDLERVELNIASRSSDPRWEVVIRIHERRFIDGRQYDYTRSESKQLDRADEIVDFEREVANWFHLSESLDQIDIDFT